MKKVELEKKGFIWMNYFSRMLALFSVLLAFIVAGCTTPLATGPKFLATGPKFQYKKTPEKMAVVTHYRKGALTGGAVTIFLYSNGKYVTYINYSGYFQEIIDPGSYEYTKLQKLYAPSLIGDPFVLDNIFAKVKPSITLKTHPGKEYYIKWKIVWFKGLVPEVVPKEKALKDLKGLKRF